MKKLNANLFSSNLNDLVSSIENDTEDDIAMIGNATKANNLALLLQAASINKAAITAAQESLAAAENAERTRKEELETFVTTSLEENEEYRQKRAAVELAAATLTNAVNNLNILMIEKRRLSSVQKLYLKDSEFVNLIGSEEQIGIDMQNIGGQKVVLSTKEKGVEYEILNDSLNFYEELLRRIPEADIKKYVTINLALLEEDHPELMRSLLLNDMVSKNEIKEAKVNTTTSTINHFNWLSPVVED